MTGKNPVMVVQRKRTLLNELRSSNLNIPAVAQRRNFEELSSIQTSNYISMAKIPVFNSRRNYLQYLEMYLFVSVYDSYSFVSQKFIFNEPLKLKHLGSVKQCSSILSQNERQMKQTILSNENFVKEHLKNFTYLRCSHANNESILSKVLHFYDISIKCKLIYTAFIREIIFTRIYLHCSSSGSVVICKYVDISEYLYQQTEYQNTVSK